MRRRRSGQLTAVLVLAAVTVLFAIISAVGIGAVSIMTRGLYGQRASDFYAADTSDYAQISMFVAEDAYLAVSDIESASSKYTDELKAVSLEAKDGARLFIDAYSCEGEVNVSTPDEGLISASLTVKATAVGGDFFDIHRLEFISGQPFYDDDVTSQRAVLDELAAWRLYGASDIAGMTVVIDGTIYEIAGVVKAEDYDYYGIVPRIYIPYTMWNEMNDAPPITCYEAVLPEPLTGFAEELVKKAFSLDDESYEIKVNSERYSLLSLLEGSSDTFGRGTRSNEVYYPHWENHALEIENRCTVWAVVSAVSAVIAGLSAVVIIMLSLTWLSKFISEYREKHRR